MRRQAFFGILVAAIAVIAIYGYFLIPDDEMVSFMEREAAANNAAVETENETEIDETLLSGRATEVPEVELSASPDESPRPPAERDVLTVDGYDPQRVRFLLQDTDMSVEVREDYLSRLETAYGDNEALAVVLEELRTELQPG